MMKEKVRGKRAMTGGSPGAAREKKGAGEEGCLRWAGLGQAQMGWTCSARGKRKEEAPFCISEKCNREEKKKEGERVSKNMTTYLKKIPCNTLEHPKLD